LGDRNFDLTGVIGSQFCTSSRNLVRFGSVTSEFKTLEFVQSASKIFWECLQVRLLGDGVARHCGKQ